MSTFIKINDAFNLEIDDHDTITVYRRNTLIESVPVGHNLHSMWLGVLDAMAAASPQPSSSYANGHDDGYRAGMQEARTMLAEGTLPPGFDWEVVINGTHAHQDPHNQAGYKRMVGPKIPISPEQASEEAIAELRRRLTAS